METAIAVEDLKKTYQPKTRKGAPVKAVDGISFGVARGEFFGLLGPNGAGKTTTIGVLTTRVVPTGGVARIEGIDVARNPVAVNAHVAVVGLRRAAGLFVTVHLAGPTQVSKPRR